MREDRRKLAAIMAADVAGYSRLMGRDEAATVAALNACRAVFRAHIATHDGRVVDTAGDSVLAVFDSVVEAVQCGLDIQNELADLDPDQPDDSRMRFRIGVNLGDVIVQGDGTIYGDGVKYRGASRSACGTGNGMHIRRRVPTGRRKTRRPLRRYRRTRGQEYRQADTRL